MNVIVLDGRNILVLDGAAVADGPDAAVPGALALIAATSDLDGAVLDGDLPRERLLPVLEALTRRGLPFVLSAPSTPSFDGVRSLDRAEGALARLAARLLPNHGVQAACRNTFLRSLPAEHFARLAPELELVEVNAREILLQEERDVEAVFFPETAVFSVLAGAQRARSIEVGMIGHEGMTDVVLQAGERPALRTCVLVSGRALAIAAEPFAAAMSDPGFRALALACREALAVQFAFSAMSHGTTTIDARLARWILMLDDRMKGAALPVVHSHVAELLAVRRSGVTTALHVLEGLGAIKSLRGRILVRDRSVLKQFAGAAYGAPEAEYERLIARAMRWPPDPQTLAFPPDRA